jgi:hypothetical protein
MFVGLLSFKSATKISSNLDIVHLIEQSTTQFSAADVIALLAPRGETLRRQAQMTHGLNFIEVWHELLRRLGFSEDMIHRSDKMDVFFCNYWVAKPAVMTKFIVFLRHAIDIMETDSVLFSLIQADAKYREGNAAVAYRAFGTPFYQYHPFICERLAVLFFWSQRACIVHTRTQFQPL